MFCDKSYTVLIIVKYQYKYSLFTILLLLVRSTGNCEYYMLFTHKITLLLINNNNLFYLCNDLFFLRVFCLLKTNCFYSLSVLYNCFCNSDTNLWDVVNFIFTVYVYIYMWFIMEEFGQYNKVTENHDLYNLFSS